MPASDVEQFVELCHKGARAFFDTSDDVAIARAPARLDLMGGIADYSGSVVLEGTLAEAAIVGLQRRGDDRVRIWSYRAEQHGFGELFEMRLGAFRGDGTSISYQEARALFAAEPQTAWAAYLAGAFHVLMAEGVVDEFSHGANILLSSDIPPGTGVSSSAAIEVATMHAINAAYGLELAGLELARLCQIVENRVVGAPCGIMDQVTCALGQQGKLLALKCQPHDILGYHALPPGCAVFGINSNVKHSVGGSHYTRTRAAAFMGHRIITRQLGSDPYGGHLCNISPSEYRQRFFELLPGRQRGSDFLAAYDDTIDQVTKVQPSELYSVRACTEHPIYRTPACASSSSYLTKPLPAVRRRWSVPGSSCTRRTGATGSAVPSGRRRRISSCARRVSAEQRRGFSARRSPGAARGARWLCWQTRARGPRSRRSLETTSGRRASGPTCSGEAPPARTRTAARRCRFECLGGADSFPHHHRLPAHALALARQERPDVVGD